MDRRAWRSGGIDMDFLAHTGLVRRQDESRQPARAEEALVRSPEEVIDDMATTMIMESMEEGAAA